jgi:DNA-binding transcriptional MerR regulator
MPRHTNRKRTQRRSTAPPERGRTGRRRLPPQDVDAQALALRESGSSFSAIARQLELGRATDAHQSFVRALRTHDGDERRQLLEHEEERLDRLEQRIRQRDAGDATKVERRLQGVKNLREALER